MLYHSTRGQDCDRDFADVLLNGLATDGGLFLPATWPVFKREEIEAMIDAPYAEVASRIMTPFVGDVISSDFLLETCRDVYGRFHHEEVAPLRPLGDETHVLELFHGPTLAFKDFAMQILGPLFEHVLQKRGRRMTIVGATSGDTGSAAIEALKGLSSVDVFILHPKGRVSEVQRRMMTCVQASNVHNIAIEGTFDDCQRLVKELFADQEFRQQTSLGAINSINWARIMAQIVYYFTAALAFGKPLKKLSFVVPTGNFGDIFAGYVAAKMGLPIERLCVATNENDILDRVMKTGEYCPKEVRPTSAPSMDIQVSSNFERLIYESLSRDGEGTASLMDNLKREGQFSLPEAAQASISQLFCSSSVREEEIREMTAWIWAQYGYLIDPHTAIGLAAREKMKANDQSKGHYISLATAHTAKFPEIVTAASGQKPQLPTRYKGLHQAPENYQILKDDLKMLQKFVLGRVE